MRPVWHFATSVKHIWLEGPDFGAIHAELLETIIIQLRRRNLNDGYKYVCISPLFCYPTDRRFASSNFFLIYFFLVRFSYFIQESVHLRDARDTIAVHSFLQVGLFFVFAGCASETAIHLSYST